MQPKVTFEPNTIYILHFPHISARMSSSSTFFSFIPIERHTLRAKKNSSIFSMRFTVWKNENRIVGVFVGGNEKTQQPERKGNEKKKKCNRKLFFSHLVDKMLVFVCRANTKEFTLTHTRVRVVIPSAFAAASKKKGDCNDGDGWHGYNISLLASVEILHSFFLQRIHVKATWW